MHAALPHNQDLPFAGKLRSSRSVLLLLLAWCSLLFPAAAHADSADFLYYEEASSITIYGYIGGSQVVMIPATIDGLPVRRISGGFFSNQLITSVSIPDSVTSLQSSAFYECRNLTSVVIGNGVTSIGGYTFYGCTNLTSVVIGNGVTSIGNYAFDECRSLTGIVLGNGVTSIGERAFHSCVAMTSFTMPGSVRSIGKMAFAHCWSLTGLTIPNGVTSIEDYCFSYCFALASVTIPTSVTSIGKFAFERCESLAGVTIPNSVTSIGIGAFSGCKSLVSVTIPNGVTVIESPIFTGCKSLLQIEVANGNPAFHSVEGVLFNQDQTTLLDYPGGKVGSYTIPSHVDSIGNSAFSGNLGLTKLTIPDGVTTIGYSAFYGCAGLTSVTIGSGITHISDYAFGNCGALTEVTMSNGVESIGDSAFSRCYLLQTVDIPASVKTINAFAFANCQSLTGVTIPSGVGTIGNRAFEWCSELAVCLFLGSPPSSFGTNVFRNSPKTVIHYRPDSIGFTTPTWNGYPCKPLISRSGVATVTMLKGTVSVIRDGSRKALNVANPIYLDDIIVTQLQSFAKLVFLDGSSMNIGPKSSLKIDYDIESPRPSFQLNRGDLRFYKTPGKTIYIDSETASVGVRGTTLTVEASEENGILTTTTEVLEGVVDHEDLVTGEIDEIRSGESISSQSAVAMRTLTIHHTSSLGTLSVNGTEITSFPHVVNYAEGTVIDLQAVPAPAMAFSRWSGDFVCASPVGTFFVQQDMTVTANVMAWTNYGDTHPALDPDEDTNGNGGSNFLDYAGGQHPEASGTQPVVDLRAGLLTMRQRINGLDATPAPQYSHNLTDWHPLVEGTHYTVISRTVNGEMRTVVVELVQDSASGRFFRQAFGP